MRQAAFYLSQQSIVGHAYSSTVNKEKLFQSPPEIIDINSPVAEIGNFVLKVLSYSLEGIQEPEDKSSVDPLLKLAHVKSLRAFNRIWKKTAYILNKNNSYKIYPTKRAGRSSLFLAEKLIEIESPDSNLLGEKLLQAFELSL
jgi:hypothetical protein